MEHFFVLLICLFAYFNAATPAEEYNKLEWIAGNRFNKDKQHEQAGSDGNEPIYVARVDHGSGQLLGSFDRVNKITVLLDNSPRNFQMNGQILVYPKGAVSWTVMKYESKLTPHNLLLGGFDPTDFEPVYICRAMLGEPRNRKVCIGTFKISTQNFGCKVIENGAPVYVDQKYEVASLSFLGIAKGAGND